MTLNEIRRYLTQRLAPAVGDAEARDMARVIIEEITGYTPVKMLLHDDRDILDETAARMTAAVDRVIAGEPLQYVLGTARFHGRDFAVNPDVLIPRPETSQLCDIITDNFSGRSDLRVLDIGTGSGAIAVTLALDLPFSKVTAVDISPRALAVAAGNAKRLRARITPVEANAFTMLSSANPALEGPFDIIVSNPPYVLESERSTMDARVTGHEPDLALFVEDSRPIEIYKAIAGFAAARLAKGGRLYLELNPLCADAVKEVLTAAGLAAPTLLRDYRGNIRFASASKQ